MFVGLILIFQLFNKVDVLRNLLITFTDVWNTILGNKKTKKRRGWPINDADDIYQHDR